MISILFCDTWQHISSIIRIILCSTSFFWTDISYANLIQRFRKRLIFLWLLYNEIIQTKKRKSALYALLVIVSSLFILALLHRNIAPNDVAAVRTSCTPSAPERENAQNPNKTAYNQCVAVCFSWHLHMIHIFMIFTYVCSFYNTEQWMQHRKCKYFFFWIWCLHLLLNCFPENCFRNYTFSKICAAGLSQTFNGILTAKNPFVLFYFLFLYFLCHIITLGRSISVLLHYHIRWKQSINSVSESKWLIQWRRMI